MAKPQRRRRPAQRIISRNCKFTAAGIVEVDYKDLDIETSSRINAATFEPEPGAP